MYAEDLGKPRMMAKNDGGDVYVIRREGDIVRLTNHEQLFEPTDLTVLGDVVSDFEMLIEKKGAELNIGQLPKLETKEHGLIDPGLFYYKIVVRSGWNISRYRWGRTFYRNGFWSGTRPLPFSAYKGRER